MGCTNIREKNDTDDIQRCTYCKGTSVKFLEYFPIESGGYSMFAPRDNTEYACELCAFKNCDDCGKKLPRSMFIDCNLCKKIHCFNNTDMKYDNNSMLLRYELCDARHCGKGMYQIK